MLLRDKPWDKELQVLLTLMIGFNLLPHVRSVPIWISILAFGCVTWKLLYLTRGYRLPKRSVLSAGALVGTAGVFLAIPLPFSLRTAAAMLVVIASFKLLETNRYRDAMLIAFASYFLLLIQLLTNPTLGSTIFMCADLVLITALMMQIHTRDRSLSIRGLKPSWKLIGPAIPLCLFLFFVFPRFSVGAWNLKEPVAETGFSDSLNPGSIGKLVNSNETAFRVKFHGAMPRPISLYWRGAVLPVADGLKWYRIGTSEIGHDQLLSRQMFQQTVSYDLWLEPGYQRWIFTLEYPNTISSNDEELLALIRREAGFTFQTTQPLFNRASYTVQSTWGAPDEVMTERARRRYVSLPQMLSPEIHKLAASIKKSADEKLSERIREPALRYSHHVVDWFIENGFRYSRTPDAMTAPDGSTQLSEFLFNKKRGFCEHFAAAFATLMRAMDVPARVVTGFQGGVPNDIGGYLFVRRMDAHAWAEVWVPGRGSANDGRWIRVDPTERIAPLRLQLGGDFYRVDATTLSEGLSSEEIQKIMKTGVKGFVTKVQNAYDVAQMNWNMFLMKYDSDFQEKVVKKLGIEISARWFLAAFVAGGILLFFAVIAWSLRRKTRRDDPAVMIWRKFCSSLERKGMSRGLNEGPMDFAERAVKFRPEKSREIRAIAQSYARIRYGMGATPSEAKAFRREVRLFARGA